MTSLISYLQHKLSGVWSIYVLIFDVSWYSYLSHFNSSQFQPEKLPWARPIMNHPRSCPLQKLSSTAFTGHETILSASNSLWFVQKIFVNTKSDLGMVWKSLYQNFWSEVVLKTLWRSFAFRLLEKLVSIKCKYFYSVHDQGSMVSSPRYISTILFRTSIILFWYKILSLPLFIYPIVTSLFRTV